MRILLFSFLLAVYSTLPAIAQQDYHPAAPVNKYFYQCVSHIGPGYDYGSSYRNNLGYIGTYQFGIVSAYEAGLCSNPVPAMRKEQIWKFCNFSGPIAQKYNLHDQYDLRFSIKAAVAQKDMMKNLTDSYDAYIYQRKYDQLFGKMVNGVLITPDILRGLLHTKGRMAVDEFLHEREIHDNKNEDLYPIATCLDQCITSKTKQWLCH